MDDMSIKNSQLRSNPVLLQLSEVTAESPTPQVPTRVQILKVGTFFLNDSGKKVEITRDMLLKFKENYDKRVRGIDLAIDMGHETDREAAGWFKELQLSEDGTELWSEVKWTPLGQRKVQDAEYRYLSADINLNFKSNEDQKVHGPTLMGAGLTNRPFIKNMEPVTQLSEKENTMDPKDQQIADLQKTVTELQAQIAALKPVEVQLSEAKNEVIKLKEEKATSEKEAKFSVMLSEGKAVAAQKEAFMAGDMMKFAELAQPVNTKAQGNDGEKNPNKKTEEGSAQDQIHQFAEKAVADKKAKNYSEGIKMALREKPELRKAYEQN